jgi:transglutaminase-like putative cysteine protease
MKNDRLRATLLLLGAGCLLGALGATCVGYRLARSLVKERLHLSYIEATFYRELRATVGESPVTGKLTMADVVRTAARLNGEYNRSMSARAGHSHWDEPVFAREEVLAFSNDEATLVLPELREYEYEVTNAGTGAVTGCILYQDYRWDSADALAASAGWRDMTNEMERAIAIWRFVVTNRYNAFPPTEDTDEHDVIRCLSVYGYGFCDDTARLLARLWELAGLEARVWASPQHYVAEAFVGGQWRFFDADLGFYFHERGRSDRVLSLAEAARDAAALEHAVYVRSPLGGQGGGGAPPSDPGRQPKYRAEWLAGFREGREVLSFKSDMGTNYICRYVLRSGETIAFGSYSVGRSVAGPYPPAVPDLRNGRLMSTLSPGCLRHDARVVTAWEDGVLVLTNVAATAAGVEMETAVPFPVVGIELGAESLAGQGCRVKAEAEGWDHPGPWHPLNRDAGGPARLVFDAALPVLAPHPCHRWRFVVHLEPHGYARLARPVATTRFQFGSLPLLKLKGGENAIRWWGDAAAKANCRVAVRF